MGWLVGSNQDSMDPAGNDVFAKGAWMAGSKRHPIF